MLFSIDRWRGTAPPLSCITILGVVLLNVVAKPQGLHVNPSSYIKDKSLELNNQKVIVGGNVTTSPVVEFFSNHSASIVPFVKDNKRENSNYFGVDKFWKHFEEDIFEVPNYIPLNKSNFLISHKRFRRNTEEEAYPPIPRFMMEFFAEGDRARKLPEGATAVRSYPIIFIEKCGIKTEKEFDSLEPKHFLREKSSSYEDDYNPLRNVNISGIYFKTDVNNKRITKHLVKKKHKKNRKTWRKKVINELVNYSNNELISSVNKNMDIDSPVLNLDSPSKLSSESAKLINNGDYEVTGKENFKMFFNLTFPSREAIHSAVLRLYTRTRRKNNDDNSGVERRIRVFLKKQTNIQNEAVRTPIIEKDIYLRTNSWVELDVTPAAFYFKNNPSQIQNIEVEVSAEFLCVGGQGKLEFVLDFESSLRPYLLIYSTSFKAIMRESTENVSYRKRRSVNSAEFEEEETNMIWDGDAAPLTGLPPNILKGKKLGRKARRKRAKNACKRKPLTVEFKEIDWDHWIIAPQTYEAYQCSGKCYYPLPSHLSPTKHAVIQNLIHSKQPESTPRACCVPTKLGPISLLYWEANVPTYNYDYGEMVVLECGCR